MFGFLEMYHGNVLDVLRKDIGTFDAVISDPPYASGGTLADKQQSTKQKYTSTKRTCPFPDFCGDSMDQRAEGWLSFTESQSAYRRTSRLLRRRLA